MPLARCVWVVLQLAALASGGNHTQLVGNPFHRVDCHLMQRRMTGVLNLHVRAGVQYGMHSRIFRTDWLRGRRTGQAQDSGTHRAHPRRSRCRT
eukprot:898601-Amphidinium_carterae.1